MSKTPQETKFLESLHAEFTQKKGSKKTEEMTGLETRIYAALDAELSKDGQTGWQTVQTIVQAEIDRAVNDVREGKAKLGEIVKLSFLEKAGKVAEKTGITVPGAGTVRGPKDKDKSALTEKQEESIRSSVDSAKIIGLATTSGLPEKSETSLGEFLVQAAGADKKLDQKELNTLAKNTQFLAAAATLGAKGFTVHNDADDSKDALLVGSRSVLLAESGVRFTDDVKSTDVAAPAAPAKAPAKAGGRKQ